MQNIVNIKAKNSTDTGDYLFSPVPFEFDFNVEGVVYFSEVPNETQEIEKDGQNETIYTTHWKANKVECVVNNSIAAFLKKLKLFDTITISYRGVSVVVDNITAVALEKTENIELNSIVIDFTTDTVTVVNTSEVLVWILAEPTKTGTRVWVDDDVWNDEYIWLD